MIVPGGSPSLAVNNVKRALRVAGQPMVEANPDIAGAVFAKRTRPVVLERGEPG